MMPPLPQCWSAESAALPSCLSLPLSFIPSLSSRLPLTKDLHIIQAGLRQLKCSMGVGSRRIVSARPAWATVKVKVSLGNLARSCWKIKSHSPSNQEPEAGRLSRVLGPSATEYDSAQNSTRRFKCPCGGRGRKGVPRGEEVCPELSPECNVRGKQADRDFESPSSNTIGRGSQTFGVVMSLDIWKRFSRC